MHWAELLDLLWGSGLELQHSITKSSDVRRSVLLGLSQILKGFSTGTYKLQPQKALPASPHVPPDF